jgi:hypothetical protein
MPPCRSLRWFAGRICLSLRRGSCFSIEPWAGSHLLFFIVHDSLANLAPLRRIAAQRRVPFITAVELSPSWGHFNAYPIAANRTLSLDTGMATGQRASHRWTKTGKYQVKLKAQCGECEKSAKETMRDITTGFVATSTRTPAGSAGTGGDEAGGLPAWRRQPRGAGARAASIRSVLGNDLHLSVEAGGPAEDPGLGWVRPGDCCGSGSSKGRSAGRRSATE